MYLIMGQYEGRDAEEIDEFDTRKEALQMLAEYQLAYGSGWRLWVRKKKLTN
jgi:hypothetical protein